MANNIDEELAKIEAQLDFAELKTELAGLRMAVKRCFDAAVDGFERLNRTIEEGLKKIKDEKND